MFACGWYSHSYFSVRNIQCDRVQGQRVARPPSSSHQHYLVLPESHLEQLGQTAWNNRRLVWSNASILWGGNDSGQVYWKSESCPWAKCCLINTLTRDNRYWRHSFHRVGPVGTSMCLYLRYFLYCLPYCQECFELGGHLKVLLVNVGYRTIREQQANVTGYFQACNFLGYPYSCKANNRFLFDNFSCSG